MGAGGCKAERCASCCTQSDVQDIVALRPGAGAPGLDTARKGAGLPQTPRGAAENPGEAEGPDVHETYDDGSTYDGQILDGERHGRGVWRSQSESYQGEWFRDNRHGKGRQAWDDGRSYEGQFRVGKFHGFGRMEWSTPQGLMSYEGEYCDDLKHGDGKYSWPDGRVYDGQWVNGARSGRAVLVNPKGDRRQGMWKADKFERWIEGNDTAPPSF